MSEPDPRHMIRRYFAATRAMDREAWVACFAEDGRSYDPVGTPPLVGREALGAFFDAITSQFREVGLHEEQVHVCGERAAVKWTGRGISTAGTAVVFEGVDVFLFDAGGRIQTLEAYWDPAALLARLGAAVQPRTLVVDIGGTGTKAAVFDAGARPLSERLQVETPNGEPSAALLDAIEGLARRLPEFERISAGFPGVVRGGVVSSAPHPGHAGWLGLDLAGELERRLGRPARALNDADLLGLGLIRGRGLEVCVSLGTGVGFAVYEAGRLGPRLELAHHPLRKGKTYNEVLGERARRKAGNAKWKRRVRHALEAIRVLTCYDALYITGGNARHIDFELPPGAVIASDEAALAGGVALWSPARA